MADDDITKLRIDKTASAGFSSRRRHRALIAVVIVIVILFVGLAVSGVLSPAVEVEIASVGAVYPSQGISLLNASGYVVAQRKASVASKVTGLLTAISVEEGTPVKKGDVIARLEHEDALADRRRAAETLKASRALLSEAEAEIRNAEAEHKRGKSLVEKGYISKSEFDALETRADKARAAGVRASSSVRADEAALAAAEVALEYTVIRAPFDAVVLTKNADVGDIITPLGAAANAKAAVVTIADMSSLQVEVDVSESNLGQVKSGQPCEIQLDALPASRFRGQVHMIVPTADRTKAAVLVKIRFLDKDSRILPEMSAKVAFLDRALTDDERKPRIAVSASSIIARDGSSSVFRVQDDRAVETTVTLGERIGDMVEVKDGLQAGEKIVAKPPAKIRNAMRIKPVSR